MLAVDEQVVVLVALQGQLVHLVARPAQGHGPGRGHLGQGQLVRQHRAHQVLRALAHRALDQIARHRRQAQVVQRVVERDHEVAQRVHHRAVEVHDDGANIQKFQVISPENVSKPRMPRSRLRRASGIAPGG
ncbi:hypothetical protein FQZ97_1012000 [compost metagenome]